MAPAALAPPSPPAGAAAGAGAEPSRPRSASTAAPSTASHAPLGGTASPPAGRAGLTRGQCRLLQNRVVVSYAGSRAAGHARRAHNHMRGRRSRCRRCRACVEGVGLRVCEGARCGHGEHRENTRRAGVCALKRVARADHRAAANALVGVQGDSRWWLGARWRTWREGRSAPPTRAVHAQAHSARSAQRGRKKRLSKHVKIKFETQVALDVWMHCYRSAFWF